MDVGNHPVYIWSSQRTLRTVDEGLSPGGELHLIVEVGAPQMPLHGLPAGLDHITGGEGTSFASEVLVFLLLLLLHLLTVNPFILHL